MPDATITSTASTFGTISGTFAADQSTVTGTITGTVTGTLTGSVGVPGPQGAQGPTGATGATGATGPAGSPGAPGQGVPVGGTAGQFLSKIDSTNYNTDWTTVNLSVYAVKANNLSDLADAPTARTNLGLGTMATATAADYSTTTVANGLYYPLTGNPSGFLSSVPAPTLTNLTSDISWDGSANTGRLLIAGVNDIGGGNTEARLNFTSGVPTQPATGDFWSNGTDFFYRESGSTKTIASQSYVSATYQTLAGMSSYLTTASAAATYFTIASAANKADLASPTFTGTPTLPTGTIATTQSPGNNTTALATTAFVTAADNLKANLASPSFSGVPTAPVPGISTRTSQLSTRSDTWASILCPGLRITPIDYMQSAVTGTGAAFNNFHPSSSRLRGPNALTVGSALQRSNNTSQNGNNNSLFSRGLSQGSINWTKPVAFSIRCMLDVMSSGSIFRITVGKPTGSTTGDLSTHGIGVKQTSTDALVLQSHNGTTLTSTTSSFTPVAGQAYDLEVYSDGSGNAYLYVNDSQVATNAGAPTTASTSNGGQYMIEVVSDGTQASQANYFFSTQKIFYGV